MSFDIEVNKILGVEGGYSNNANDGGGETIWGITEAVARANGYLGPMSAMPRSAAILIYKSTYWGAAGCDYICHYYSAVAADLFETGVNIGVETAGAMLQRSLNALMPGKLTVDGKVGAATGGAIATLWNTRNEDGGRVLRSMFLSLVSVHYISIVESDPSQVEFIYGWELNRVYAAP